MAIQMLSDEEIRTRRWKSGQIAAKVVAWVKSFNETSSRSKKAAYEDQSSPVLRKSQLYSSGTVHDSRLFIWYCSYTGERKHRGKQSISLEPGGQFELSGAPVETLHQTCSEVNSHLYQ
ncbi:Glutamate--cysteine ligase, GCS2, partial [Cynara cardunculus var. scolymus]